MAEPMGRIRALRPEGVRSLQIAEIPPAVRFTFIALWCFCDDEGRIEDDPRVIKAEVYPYDDITAAEVGDHLDAMANADLICRYADPSGARFLHVLGFSGDQKSLPFAQRPNKPTPSGRPPCLQEHYLNGQLPLSYESGSGTGALPEPSGRTTPRREEKGREESMPAKPPTAAQRSKTITDAYHAAVNGMCKWPAVNQIVTKAIKADEWADDQIRAAVLRLAADNRPVTVDTLRIELTAGSRSPGPSGGDDYVPPYMR
jgi:hypothetical protein